MSDFTVRSDSVDVEQIMRQIRARIREKRGVDYTEEEIQELAKVKLEKFLDPRGVRSDLIDQFRRSKAALPAPKNFSFEDDTLYETHRGIIRWIRKLLNPILKLFLNPNPLIQALHIQSELNTRNAKREELDTLQYEVLHNLVLELTRLGIEVKNLKMRVESMSSRLDFDERRARALEGVVMYRPGAAAPLQPPKGEDGRGAETAQAERRTRRRRRRRAKRPGERTDTSPGAESGEAELTADEGGDANPPDVPDSPDRLVKLAIAVQRYGADINGGAELHARYIAERLARHAEVEVVTTCARDYVTWRNELAPGADQVHGVSVRRFPVQQERMPREFGRWSNRVFTREHSIADELAWLESEGPASPAMIDYLATASFDFAILFSYRYYHAWHAARRVHGRAVLVPTAERDPAIALHIFGPVFRGVRAIMYNSPEERAMIQAATRNHAVPGVVVGVGSDVPDRTDPARFRRKYRIARPFAMYIGRIDENKGCGELFEYLQRYAAVFPRGLDLVLLGSAMMPVPAHPRIHHLGFIDDEDKFDGLAASDLLIMPSYFESLSMVALEAWALGRPVLANGRCDVLKGQCIRSNAGLYYESFEEFAEALYALESNGPLHVRLGHNGRDYFRRNYTWPVIERKYLDMLQQLQRAAPSANTREPLPGWFARRRARVPPAEALLDALPSGPAVGPESA